MIKHKDDFFIGGYNANDYDFSAVSGHSLSEIETLGKSEESRSGPESGQS